MATTLELSELDAMIGRLFMAGMPGKHLDKDSRDLIRRGQIGGIILFSRNIADPLQVATLCRAVQQEAVRSQGEALLIAADQEGGPVARLPFPFTRFAGAEAMALSSDPEQAVRRYAAVTAREMTLVGLNANLAPVLDLAPPGVQGVLAGRSLGRDPARVARLGWAIITVFQQGGLLAVAKHFPGLGATGLDPHQALPTISLAGEDEERRHLAPFQEAVRAKVAGIMTAHAVYPHRDPRHPATLSPALLNGLLREQWGYEGLIVTDDLEMGAITGQWDVAEGAAAAFKAGADILLICRNQEHVRRATDRIRGALLREEIPLSRLLASSARIRRARSRLAALTPDMRAVKAYFHL